MSTTEFQFHAITPEGRVQVSQLASLGSTSPSSALISLPLIVKAQPGFQYKLIDSDSGSHRKGQKLLRSQKNLQVLLDDTLTLELQDYFFASAAPLPNPAVYRLENQSCDEVQVTANLPQEAFSVPQSLVWTERDDAQDCKVALLNPSSFLAFIPATPAVTGVSLAEISGGVAGVIALSSAGGGGNSPGITPSQPHHTSITSVELTSSTGERNQRLNATDTLTVTVTFDGTVVVNTSAGSPLVNLSIGDQIVQASYVSGSGTNALTFITTIVNGLNDIDGVAISSNALVLNGASIKDSRGNDSINTSNDVANNALFMVDTTAPIATLEAGSFSLRETNTSSVNVKSNELGTAYLVPTTSSVLTLQDLENLSPLISKSIAIVNALTPIPMSLAGLPVARYQLYTVDLAGNVSSSSQETLQITQSPTPPLPPPPPPPPPEPSDTTPPKLTTIALTSSTGDIHHVLNAGDTLTTTVTFDDLVTVNLAGGIPSVSLLIGSSTVQATYAAGSGTTALTFTTTIVNGLNDSDGIAMPPNALNLNGGQIQDTAGNQSILEHAAINANPDFLVDTTSPTVVITSDVSVLKAGVTANITFSFSEDPGSSFTWDGAAGDVQISGGTLSAVLGAGLSRTAVFTPTANQGNGIASVSVNANAYEDAAGNLGLTGVSPSFSLDTAAPVLNSVAISGAVGANTSPSDASVKLLNAGDALLITTTFSEVVLLDLTAGTPTLSVLIGSSDVLATYVSGSGSSALVFSTTVVSGQTDTDGVAISLNSLSLNGATLKDVAGNPGVITSLAVTANAGFLVDTQSPTVSISSNFSALKSGESANITFTFSEDPGSSFTWDGSVGDIALTGGTLSAISGTGLTRTAVFTPSVNLASGNASITVTANSYQDAAGNNGSAGISPSISLDTLPPGVNITASTSALKSGETATITFTFSEDPGSSFTWNGSVGDVVVTGGTLGAISGTSLTRTATLTPTANLASGSASIVVAANAYHDAAGNFGSAGASPNISIDTLAPNAASVALSGATGDVNHRLNAGDTLNATLTFNDAVTLNTTAGSPSLSLLIGSSTVQAAYVSGSGTNALLFTTTIVNGQTDTDGVAIALNPLNLNGATLKDSAGNTSVNSLSAVLSNSNYLVDTTAPTVSITSNLPALKAGDSATITFTFSEDPDASFAWDGALGDVVVTGGTFGAISGTGLTRSAIFTPTANLASTTASISVINNSYQDAAGNNGSAGSLTTLSVDTLAPSLTSIAVTSATGAVASPSDTTVKLLNTADTLSASVIFTEAVTLVTSAGSPTLALVIGSSTVLATYVSGSGTNTLLFSTTIVSGQTDSDGVAIALNALTLNGATLKDAAGNSSVITTIAVADNAKYLVDTSAPSISITSNVTTLKAGETAAITFTFSEDPGSSFVWSSNFGDVIVSGGTLSDISGTGLTRNATFTPSSNVVTGVANISVNAGTYTDAAGNAGGAGTTPLLTFSTTTPTVSQVGLSSATGSLNNLLNAGDMVYAKVVFSEAIVLNNTGGSPTLGLTVGSTLVQAAYVSGSGTTDFVFGYTILSGQDDANGISIPLTALTLNGSTLKSPAGNAVTLTNAIATDNILYAVDTTPPSVVITSALSTLKSGETSLICFTFSEDPGTSFGMTDITVTGGTLSALTGLGTVRRSIFTPSNNVTNGTASITVADASYTDDAGNLGTAGTTPAIAFHTLASTVGSIALSSATGSQNNTLNAGDTLSVTATFSDVVTLNANGGSPTLALAVGGSTVQATYVSGSGTNALVFATTILNGQTDTDGVAIPLNALTLNGATLKDANGNASSILSSAVASNVSYLVDTTAPSVVISSNVSTLTSGTTANITFTFTEDPDASFAWDGSSGDVVVTGGTLSTLSGTGLTRTAVFTPATNQGSGVASISVPNNSYQDAAGNNGAAGTTPTLNLDTVAPTITSLELTSSSGGIVSASDATINNLNAGDTLNATVTFNDVITVDTSTGRPTLELNVGGSLVQAAYASGSGSNSLVFTATITSGLNDDNGVTISTNALKLNGGTLKDGSGNNSTLTSVAVVDNAHYLVDTTRPTATVTSSTNALISGQTATITFTFSEDPGSSFAWDGAAGDLTVTGGTLGALSTTGNPLTRTAVLTPRSGVSAGVANVAIQIDSYTDAAGNVGQEALVNVTDKTSDISVNTTTTTVASAVLLSATGIQNNLLNQGDVISVAVNFTEAVFLDANAGVPTLGLTIGNAAVSASYASGAGTPQLIFNYTILAGQNDANGVAINANSLSLNGKVITDTAGNTPTLTFSAVADNANYLVDTTAPTLVSIGTNRSTFLSGEIATITFTFSEDPGSTFTWNGTAGDVTLVNGTLSALSGTGLTRTATFLPTQGLTGGNASITVSNNLFTDDAGNLGVGNTLGSLVVNTSPAALMDVQVTSAVGVLNNALNAGDVVTVTAHFSEAQTLNTSGGIPSVALNIGGTTVNATYASGAGTANLLFTYTILAGQTDANGIAIDANSLSLNGSTLRDPRTNTTTLSVPATTDNSSFTVDTTAPSLSITSDVGQLKSGETATLTFTFSEDPGNTFTWNGTAGDVSLSGGTLGAISATGTTRTAVFTPGVGVNAGTASIAVNSGTYQDAAGNNGGAGGTPSLTFDTLAPSISTLAFSSATGALSAYLNEGDTANISVTFNDVVNLNTAGGAPTLALVIGSSTVQATYVSGAGSNTLVFTTTIAAGQNDTDGMAIALNALSLNGALLTDSAGNSATITSAAVASNASYMVDTLAPSVSLAFNVASLKAGDTATLTITANDKIGTSFTWNGTAGDLTVSGGTLGAISPFVLSGGNYVSTATFTPNTDSNTVGIVSTASAIYTDLAGNSGPAGASASVNVDTVVPTLTSMNITGASGIVSNTLNAGDVAQITAVFSEAVVVTGTPKVLLNIGGAANSATYVSGSGTTDLLFNYTVLAGDTDTNGLSYAVNALSLNGGTIKDSTGNNAVITAIARADNAAYKVDTTAPTVTITSSTTKLLVGQTANITFTFSEDPGSSFVWDGSTGDITLSNGTLSAISGTGLTRTAVFTPTANVNSGNATVVVNAGSYTDAAGNTGAQGNTPSMTIDTLGLNIYSSNAYKQSSLNSSIGMKIGAFLYYQEATTINLTGGIPTIDLIIGTTLVKAYLTAASPTNSQYLYFLTTVVADQTDTNGITIVADSLEMNGGTIKDASGNLSTLRFTGIIDGGSIVDTTAPTLIITSNKSTLKAGETATITFTASEWIYNFSTLETPPNISTPNGTLTNWVTTSSLLVKTATFTPYNSQQMVIATIELKAGVMQDYAFNSSLVISPSPVIMIDTVAPTVSISMSRNVVSTANTSLVTFTFSEDPGTSFNWNGSVGDITITNGTLGAISGTGLTRTATLTAPTNTALWNTTLSVVANSYTDAIGNLGSAATSPLYSVDSTAPQTNSRSVGSLGQVNSRVNEGDVINFTVYMDKSNMVLDTSGGLPTLSFTIGTTVVQASYASHTTSTILFNYTVLAGQTDTDGITLNANGVSYNGSVYKDSYGNLASIVYPAWTVGSVQVDTTAPTLTITSSRNAILAGQTATITFTFSEDIGTSFLIGDIVATNGVLSSFTGAGAVWTATLTPTANFAGGTSSITVAANSYVDLAGNNGSAGITPVINIDTIVPTVAVTTTKTTFKAGDTATITFTFSEDPGTSFTWNGTSGDIIFSGGTLSALSTTGNPLTRTALYTPTANNSGNPIISVRSESYQDALGNLGTSGSAPFMMYDTASPTVTAAADSITLKAGQTTRVYFTFNEDPGTSFSWNGSVGDVLITGAGTLVPDTVPSHQIYAMRGFDFTPPANVNAGSTSINVTANSYQDTVGNLGSASNTITISYDTLAPTVSITSSTALVGMGQTATITFTFSEDPGSTFTWNGTTGDVVVTQGTLGAISGTGLTRTAVFTPFADTTLTAASITVTAGSYTDAATNPGGAGTSPVLNVNTFKNAIYLDDIAANIGGYAIESPNINAKFGYAVSLAGDFNGDGYGDVVMGAPLNTFTDSGNATHTDAGAAILYEGGLNTSLVTKGYSGTGQVNGHYYTYGVNDGWFGFTVAGMGDVNNDGLADLLIGMPQGSSNPGGAFLVYGKANSTTGSLAEYQNDVSALSTTPAALSITSSFDSAGFSVSSAGDVNGDGWIDMIISAHFQSVGSLALAGKTYVIYGGAWLASKQTISLDNVGVAVPGFVISGWEAGEESGTSVSSAGDFNGDGLADLLVGSIYNNAGGQNSGATYVVLGKTDNTAVNLSSVKNNIGGFVIKGENAQDKVGVSVSSGGDINGDGIGDIIIGAIIELTGITQTARGKTYVVFGSTTANATIDLGQIASGIGGFAIVSSTNTEQSGHSVSSAGDINGDGLADIILGAPYSPVDGGASTGRSYVVYGKASTTNVSLTDVTNNIGGFAIIGQGAQDLSGFSVGAAGDVNGDGLADLIVGSPGYDFSASSTSNGRSYIIFGSKTGPFAAGTAVDNIGTSANDTLTSTGSQTLAGGSYSAGTGNDTFIASGADVLLGGMGKDIFTVNASMITALQNNLGAGGNTSQLAKIDGGAGIDTLRMGGTGGLGFDFSLVTNTSVGNIEGASRINSIERIDLRTDTASNQITLRVADVLDMAGSNWANLNTLDSLGAGGWQNVGTGTSFNAAGVKYHQVAIDGTSVDRVNTSGWTLQTTGTVRDASSVVYDVYLASSNAPAMMLVQQDIVRFSVA